MDVMGHDGSQRAGLALAVLSAISFGLSGTLATGLLHAGWSAGAVVLVRMGVGALALAPLTVRALRGRWELLRHRAGFLLVYGAVPVALAQLAYFSAVARMDVGPALLIEYTSPAAVVAWLWLRRGERPSALTLGGAALAAVGLVLVLGLLSGAHVVLVGVAWALVAMVGAASYFLLGAEASAGVPPLALAGCGLWVGAGALAVVGAIGVLPMRAATASPRYGSLVVAWWVPLVVLGVVTAGLAYAAGIAAVRRLGSRVASFVGLFEVLAGVATAWLVLSQALGVGQVVGAALVAGGVLAVNRGERRGRTAPTVETPATRAPSATAC